MMGPASMSELLPTLRLPASMVGFMQDMPELCDGTEVKEVALRGGSEEYWQRQEQRRRAELEERQRQQLKGYAVISSTV